MPKDPRTFEMDARTAAALEESIAHWTEVRDAEAPWDVHIGSRSCALCALFLAKDCSGCPIAERTNLTRCRIMPYYEAYDALVGWKRNSAAEARWRAAAQAMLDFLISLRQEAV